MMRAGADVREAEFLQQRPDIMLVIIDAEALLDELLEIDAPSAHDAVDDRVWSRLDDPH